MLIREAYLSRIRPFIDLPIIKVLTGMRRSGKSVLLQQIRDELLTRGIEKSQIVMLNFEAAEHIPLRDGRALHQHLDEEARRGEKKRYFFLDEIQEVDNWEEVLRSSLVSHNCDIYITGSNSRLLSGELASKLAGRYVSFEVSPFSFAEYSRAHREQGSELDNRELFMQYVETGGLPFLTTARLDLSATANYHRDVFASVVLNDIAARYQIRDIDQLRRLIYYLTAQIGTPVSATGISHFFRSENRSISPETILNYIRYCEDAYLFHAVRTSDLLGKQTLRVNEKYYLTDHGLRESIVGENRSSIERVLENIVYMELRRRFDSVHIGRVTVYEKAGPRNLEVDFVCRKGREKSYFQVAYLLASEKTIEREFRSLKAIPDNYPKFVLSWDDFDMSRDGIRHMNIRDFLVSETT